MNKFEIGDEVFLGDSYQKGYTVLEIIDYIVLISQDGSQEESFWVFAKDLTYIG